MSSDTAKSVCIRSFLICSHEQNVCEEAFEQLIISISFPLFANIFRSKKYKTNERVWCNVQNVNVGLKHSFAKYSLLISAELGKLQELHLN